MSTNDYCTCGAVLMPGLGCCAQRATAIAKGKRRPVLAQRPTPKAGMPTGMTYATGDGATMRGVRYVPNDHRMRTPKRERAVGVGRDNYGYARNTTLLHTHWVPTPDTTPTVRPPDPRVQAANAKLRATVARAQAVASGLAADDRFNPQR